MRRSAVAAVALTLLLGVSPRSTSADSICQDELIVRFRTVPTASQLDAVKSQFPQITSWRDLRHALHWKGDPSREHPLSFVRIAQIRAGADADELAVALATREGIGIQRAERNQTVLLPVEPNRTTPLRRVVDGPGLPTTFEPNDPLFPKQWALEKIDALGAWDLTTGSASVVVAVSDSGLLFEHEEFPDAALWHNPGEIPDNGVDDDKNGFIDDVVGWDFAEDDNWPRGSHPHGTKVSGILAARLNNGIGIAGVANVSIMTLRWAGPLDQVLGSFYYAVDMGANVINFSAGASPTDELALAVQYAWDNGVTFVAAAGNFGNSTPRHPAAYPTVIGVSNTTEDDILSMTSSFGEWVDVAAPGAEVLSTTSQARGWYELVSGTSFAAPHVSGLAALLYSVDLTLTPAEVRGLIRGYADDLGEPGFDELFGYGRINAGRTVATAVHLVTCPADISVDGSVEIGDIIAVLAAWGTDDWLADIDDNGIVGVGDLIEVLAAWGPCE